MTNASLRESFRLTVLGGDARDVPASSELLAMLTNRKPWEDACICPEDSDFPRAIVSFHQGHGFVLQCYEDESSWSEFLIVGQTLSVPAVEIELGGQALERWPSELFVPQHLAKAALDYFLGTGRQNPALCWVRIDRFPREIVWEGREGREAWEKSLADRDRDDA